MNFRRGAGVRGGRKKRKEEVKRERWSKKRKEGVKKERRSEKRKKE